MTEGKKSNVSEKLILYIEDNAHNRRIVRKILNVYGYKVIEAEDGLQGYEMIRELKPPLVLLDISLPTMDGIQIIGKLKMDEELRHIPVIALTASAMRGDREKFLNAGCDDYLSKPVNAGELHSMVDSYYPERVSNL
jgi:two-component system cell cycle response regulator DivK